MDRIVIVTSAKTSRQRPCIPFSLVNGSSSGSDGSLTPVDLRLQGGHEGEVAVPLSIVEAIADHEHAGDIEAGVLHLDVGFELLRLIEQGAHLEGRRATAA